MLTGSAETRSCVFLLTSRSFSRCSTDGTCVFWHYGVYVISIALPKNRTVAIKIFMGSAEKWVDKELAELI